MASNDSAELKKEAEEAAAAVAKLQAELAKVSAQLAAVDKNDPFANMLGEVDTLERQVQDTTKALEKAVREASSLATAFDLHQAIESMAELQKQGLAEMAVASKNLKDKSAAEAAAVKEAEKLQAAQYAAAVSAMKQYAAAEAAEAKEQARTIAEAESLRVKQYAAAVKAMKEYYAAEAKEEKEKAKREQQEWADLIATRKTLDEQEKKNIQVPAQAAKDLKTGVPAAGTGTAGASGAAEASAAMATAAFAVEVFVAVKALEKLAESAAQYVKKSDPAAVLLMNMAMEDLQAAIGSGLTPVVNALTVMFDQANAAITTFQPIIEAVSALVSSTFLDMAKEAVAFGEAIGDLAVAEIVPVAVVFQQLWEASKPLIASLVDLTAQFAKFQLDAFVGMFEAAMPVIGFFVEVISRAAKGLAFMAQVVGIFIEAIRTGRIDRIGDRVGAAARDIDRQPGQRAPAGGITVAARPATVISSEDIGTQARTAAFSGRSIAEQQLSEAQRQTDLLTRLVGNTRPVGQPVPPVSVDPPPAL